MRLSPSSIVLAVACSAFAVFSPLFAESIYEIVDQAQDAITTQFPSENSRARKMALNDLDKIIESDLSDEEKIQAVKDRFLKSASAPASAQTDAVPTDSLAQLIFRPPLHWETQSIEIAYDIDSVTNLLFSTESLYQEGNSKSRENSTGVSSATNVNAGAKTQLNLDVGGDINIKGWNPSNWFQARAGFQWVTSGYAGIDYNRTKSSQWNERAQRALSNNYEEKEKILQDTRITKCHLTFYILFKNNTDKDLLLDPREFSVPVYAGDNKPLADALPDTPLRSCRIPRNAYANLKFRAELNTTSALDLIKYMRTNEPLIRMDVAQSTIVSSDGSIRDAVQDSLQIETVPFRCRDLVLQIRKFNLGKPVTVGDAMRAINCVFEKTTFEFDENGDCVSLMGFGLGNPGAKTMNIHQLPVIGLGEQYTSAPIPAAKLKQPIPDEGLSIDVANIISEDEDDETWDNASDRLQKHYVRYLKPVAESGDARAQFIYGRCFSGGIGVDEDSAMGERWFLASAEQGLVDAQRALGYYYIIQALFDLIELDGEMSDEEIDAYHIKSCKWFRKAAEQGDATSQFMLGESYLDGSGVEENPSEAVKWYRKAAEQDLAVAQFKLGECLFDGIGADENKSEALKWYYKAAEQGDEDAQFALGGCFYYGNGVNENLSDAAEWYRKAAEQGHVGAQYSLGVCYSNDDIEENDKEAVQWFFKAAEQDNPDAKFALCLSYMWGTGVARNETESVKWCRKAAEQGHAEAQFTLGSCYFSGFGVKEDPSEAVVWFRKAAEQDHEGAKACLEGFIELADGVYLSMVKVEAGAFTMSAKDGENYSDEKPHRAVLTSDFFIGQTEVTQAQWRAVMKNNPSESKGDDLPVENVTWTNAMIFCLRLNTMGKAPDGWMFVLPTETQWEYAARGGNRSKVFKYSGSDNVDEVAWHSGNSGRKTHPVGQKKANELGLFDMSGNVWEWCLDDWNEDSSEQPAEFLRQDILDQLSGSRVLRGGCSFESSRYCRSAHRRSRNCYNSLNSIGFRLALIPTP